MSGSQTILSKIIETKQEEILLAKQKVDPAEIVVLAESSPAPRGFAKALKKTAAPAIIAEIKKASPSRGSIRPDLDPIQTAVEYSAFGASCISILTDKTYFGGENGYVTQVRKNVPVTPILRKEFIVDPFQVWETRLLGADALLLICAALSEAKLLELTETAKLAKLDVLIEVHDEAELEVALKTIEACEPTSDWHIMLGINNRDLRTFTLDRNTTPRLIEFMRKNATASFLESDVIVVSESALKTPEDIAQMHSAGAKAFLIGEALVEVGSPGANLKSLIENSRRLISRA